MDSANRRQEYLNKWSELIKRLEILRAQLTSQIVGQSLLEHFNHIDASIKVLEDMRKTLFALKSAMIFLHNTKSTTPPKNPLSQ